MSWSELIERLTRIPGGFSLGVSVEFRPLARCKPSLLPPAAPAIDVPGEEVPPQSNVIPLRRAG